MAERDWWDENAQMRDMELAQEIVAAAREREELKRQDMLASRLGGRTAMPFFSRNAASILKASRSLPGSPVMRVHESHSTASIRPLTTSPSRSMLSSSPSRSSLESIRSQKAPRLAYIPPLPPSPSWPTLKPPTLDQMERDMKKWAQTKDKIEARAMHEGRRQEYERACEVVEDLTQQASEQRELCHKVQDELQQARVLHEEAAFKLEWTDTALKESRAKTSEAEAAANLHSRELASLRAKTAMLEEQLRVYIGAENEAKRLAEAEAAKQAAKAAARIEQVGAQILRRIMNRDISIGFSAWAEMWEAKLYAMGRLRQVAGKLRNAGLYHAFQDWSAEWRRCVQKKREASLRASSDAAAAQERAAEAALIGAEMAAKEAATNEALKQLEAREKEVAALKDSNAEAEEIAGELKARDATVAKLQQQLAERIQELRAKEEAHAAAVVAKEQQHAATVAAKEKAHAAAMESLKAEFASQKSQLASQQEGSSASLEEMLAEKERRLTEMLEKQEQERKDNFMRQAIRRLQSRELASGFGAWVEMVESKAYAMQKMREIGVCTLRSSQHTVHNSPYPTLHEINSLTSLNNALRCSQSSESSQA